MGTQKRVGTPLILGAQRVKLLVERRGMIGPVKGLDLMFVRVRQAKFVQRDL